MFFLIVLFILLFLLFVYYKKFRPAPVGTFCIVNGGVKAGKSTYSVGSLVSDYNIRAIRVVVSNFFRRILKKIFKHKNIDLLEFPCFYSNVPIKTLFGYVPITKELLLREKRFSYGSVIYLQEGSLVADTMDWGFPAVDDAIKYFCKLIGHETKGGRLLVDTQSISDLHNGFRRSCSSNLYVLSTRKIPLLPFVVISYKFLYYSEDGQNLNVNTGNIDDNVRYALFLSSVWKKFDCYCYSSLTDSLEVVDYSYAIKKVDDFKARNIFRIKDFFKKENKKGVIYEKKKFD